MDEPTDLGSPADDPAARRTTTALTAVLEAGRAAPDDTTAQALASIGRRAGCRRRRRVAGGALLTAAAVAAVVVAVPLVLPGAQDQRTTVADASRPDTTPDAAPSVLPQPARPLLPTLTDADVALFAPGPTSPGGVRGSLLGAGGRGVLATGGYCGDSTLDTVPATRSWDVLWERVSEQGGARPRVVERVLRWDGPDAQEAVSDYSRATRASPTSCEGPNGRLDYQPLQVEEPWGSLGSVVVAPLGDPYGTWRVKVVEPLVSAPAVVELTVDVGAADAADAGRTVDPLFRQAFRVAESSSSVLDEPGQPDGASTATAPGRVDPHAEPPARAGWVLSPGQVRSAIPGAVNGGSGERTLGDDDPGRHAPAVAGWCGDATLAGTTAAPATSRVIWRQPETEQPRVREGVDESVLRWEGASAGDAATAYVDATRRSPLVCPVRPGRDGGAKTFHLLPGIAPGGVVAAAPVDGPSGAWEVRVVEPAGDGRTVVDMTVVVAARRGPMLTMARGLVRHDADAEDLVHDVLASALLKWRRVSAADDPAAYVNRMLVNAATSWWRRPARRERPSERVAPVVGTDRADHLVNGTCQDGDPGARAGEREAVLAALRTLPVRHRAVLVLRYYGGVPDAEIAEILRMAPSTVRSCARRGLAALRAAGLHDEVERVG